MELLFNFIQTGSWRYSFGKYDAGPGLCNEGLQGSTKLEYPQPKPVYLIGPLLFKKATDGALNQHE